jgi:hypothetical protein
MDCSRSSYAGNREPGNSGPGPARPGGEDRSGGSVPNRRPMKPSPPKSNSHAQSEAQSLSQASEDPEVVDKEGEDCDETEDVAMSTKKKKKKRNKKAKPAGYFQNSGEMHAVLRRVSMFWNTAPHAADIADAATKLERSNLALHAVKATDMLGLRSTADGIFKEEFIVFKEE